MNVGADPAEMPKQAAAGPAAEAKPKFRIDWDAVRCFVSTREFQAAALALLAILFAFFPLLQTLPKIWLDMDSHYAHGLLIPFAAGFIVYKRWDKIKDLPVKGSWFALLALAPVLYLAVIASRTVMPLVLSVALIASLLCAVWFVAGFRWTMALAPAILFLILGLPVLDRWVDLWTFKLQVVSTNVAELMLKTIGYQITKIDQTVLHMDRFDLNIAGACSGLKTTIAVSAAVILFMLVTPLRWWAHAVLAAVAIPLSIFINGFRITMIGIVGNTWGHDAGMKFHDYSGFIALVLCFLILAKLTGFLEDKS